jgi:exopolysaccharide production protein ExoZ
VTRSSHPPVATETFTNLQAGRFVAAAGVLVSHTAYYGGTYCGVEDPLRTVTWEYAFRLTVVFLFALSGFVLTHSLQRSTLRSFLGFRLLRLFAAYWVAFGAVWLVRAAAGTLPAWKASALARSWFLLPAPAHRHSFVLMVEWTLVYEFFLSLAIVPLAWWGRTKGLAVGAGAWLAVCLARLVWDPTLAPAWHPRPAELPFSVVNVAFLMGILAYFGRSWADRFRPATLLVVALSLAAGRLNVETASGWSFVLMSGAAALLVALLATGPQLPARNSLVIAGDWTYGIYLIHVPVVTAVFVAFGRGVAGSVTPAHVVFGGVLALTVGSAYGAFECGLYRRLRALARGRRPATPARVESPRPVPLRLAA